MKKIEIIKLIVPFLIILFIFGNSLKNGFDSTNSSNFITDIVYNFVDADYETLAHIVRKIAHFLEFALLGFFSYLGYKYYSFIIVVVIAFLDETIQLFIEGRSSSFIDVLIDTAGGLFGILLIISILRIRKNFKVKTI